MRRTTYADMKTALTNALGDLEILAGNRVGPSGSSWQDVAGTAATNLQWLANMLYAARQGNHEAGLVFPDVDECLEASAEVSA
jgi:hypothetical protein